MKDLKKFIDLTCWVIICFCLLSTKESKAQVKKMSAKDLTEESTAVLYGKCSKIKSEWNEDKSIIYTYVTIVPEEYLKGNLGSEMVITVPGGRVDDILYEVSEMPVFTEGEDVMTFIWTDPSGRNLVTGGSQGKMKIEKDSKTGSRMVYGLDIEEDAGSQDLGIDKPENQGKLEKVKLEEFVTKLKEYAK